MRFCWIHQTHWSCAFALVVAQAAVGALPVAGQSLCGQWGVVATPDPASSNGALFGSGIVAADDIYVMRSGVGPFVIHWDGANWTEVPLPDLSVQGSFSPRAIRAIAGEAWLACLLGTGPFSSMQLLLRWNGSAWDLEETLELQPNMAGAPRNGAPRALDGASEDDIWIVGSASGMGDGAGGPPVLTVHWDGSELSEYLTPGVGARQNHLYGVAAVASDDVWAVGYYNNVLPNALFHAMIFHWDGSSWQHVPNPAEDLDQTFLVDVVALAPDDIWAVGENFSTPLFMHYDGSAWSIVPGPPVSAAVRVFKAGAVASNDVWAVTYETVGFFHWDGSSWSIVGFPQVPGATQISLHGAMAAGGECDVWAFGSQDDGTNVSTLAVRLQPSGSPTGTGDNAPRWPALRVHQNHPNPFAATTRIAFDMPQRADVVVEVFDVSGRRLRVDRHVSLPAGPNAVELDAGSLPAGIYYYRVSAAGEREAKKMVIVR